MSGAIASVALAALALSGCAGFMSGGDRAARQAACVPTSFSLYFEPDSAALPADSEAILRQGLSGLESCRAQGGELVRATVIAYPDEAALGGAEASRIAYARTEAVVRALVATGLEPSKVVGFDHRTEQNPTMTIMRRRAEVRLEMR